MSCPQIGVLGFSIKPQPVSGPEFFVVSREAFFFETSWVQCGHLAQSSCLDFDVHRAWRCNNVEEWERAFAGKLEHRVQGWTTHDCLQSSRVSGSQKEALQVVPAVWCFKSKTRRQGEALGSPESEHPHTMSLCLEFEASHHLWNYSKKFPSVVTQCDCHQPRPFLWGCLGQSVFLSIWYFPGPLRTE